MSDADNSTISYGEYYNLGSYHRQISTANNNTQTWFNRGLIWCYGFNHEEAAYCFEQAIKSDPECTIAHWGLAYALGPNYNKPWEAFDEVELEAAKRRIADAVKSAEANTDGASPVEKALVETLKYRYPEIDTKTKLVEDSQIWNESYASSMKEVYSSFSTDLDIAALYADSLMNLTPWALWDIRTGKPAEGARTLEIKDVLESAMKLEGGEDHPGLPHLYIHLMEMSSAPEGALRAAEKLRDCVPDAGHLRHMPSHLDVLCGNWKDAVVSNGKAIVADAKYLKRSGGLNFYTIYRSHDYHFRIYAAMFSGQSKIALDTVAQLEESLPEDLLRIESPPMADWLESFLSIRIHVLVRFGLWQDLLDLQIPSDLDLYCATNAMILYGRGVAFAATGRVSEAEKARELFIESLKNVKPSRTLFNNTCLSILAIAQSMLDGEIQYRKGNFDAAFTHLEHSIKLDDGLPYDEPWGWMQPTRHAYAALLLEQGHVEKAAEVYSADLGYDDTLPRPHQHPNNIWSLHGYHECLVKLGRKQEASIVGLQLKMARAIADVPIVASCFCRLKVVES